MAVEIRSAVLLRLMRETWYGERHQICGILRGRGNKLFRADTAVAPKIVYSSEMAADLVNRIAGAITFIDAAQVGRGMRVVKIDGRMPGEKGYTLH